MSTFEGSEDAVDRFFKQGRGEDEREYPKGKLNPNDEGALAFAIAVDENKKLMVINFNKPVTWMGLYLLDARRFHEAIGKKIKQLEELEPQPTPPESSSK
jgi:hypothetical protein